LFPIRILLATDGSKEAALAAKTAADMVQKTGSELHVVYVGSSLEYVNMGPPEIGDIYTPTQEHLSAEACELLDAEVEPGQSSRGNRCKSPSWGRGTRPRDSQLGGGDKGRAEGTGEPRTRWDKASPHGSVSDSVVRHATAQYWWYVERSPRRKKSLT
jgi:hypothetical protein